MLRNPFLQPVLDCFWSCKHQRLELIRDLETADTFKQELFGGAIVRHAPVQRVGAAVPDIAAVDGELTFSGRAIHFRVDH